MDLSQAIQPNGYDQPIHPECFTCYECNNLITDLHDYSLVSGKPICSNCLPQIEERECSFCHQPIVGRFVLTKGKYFHPMHFQCCQCETPLNGRNFVVHHNSYFCPEHGNYFVHDCASCKKEIQIDESNPRNRGFVVYWRGKRYHAQCFVCRICGIKLSTNANSEVAVYSVHGRPHCKQCYEQRVADHECQEGRFRIAKTIGSHHHSPEATTTRRETFAEKFNREFIPPVYQSVLDKQREEEELLENTQMGLLSDHGSIHHHRRRRHHHHGENGEHAHHHHHHGEHGEHPHRHHRHHGENGENGEHPHRHHRHHGENGENGEHPHRHRRHHGEHGENGEHTHTHRGRGAHSGMQRKGQRRGGESKTHQINQKANDQGTQENEQLLVEE